MCGLSETSQTFSYPSSCSTTNGSSHEDRRVWSNCPRFRGVSFIKDTRTCIHHAFCLRSNNSCASQTCVRYGKWILQAFRRFIARRGKCGWVDFNNALFFKKSAKALRWIGSLIRNEEVRDCLANNTIKWKFIVRRAPLSGGVHEKLTRPVEDTLRKTVVRRRFNFESLTTILT